MSRISIFPPTAIVYPSDRQLFTVQATPPPALWVGVSNSGDIQFDNSLLIDAGQSSVSGFGGHILLSGLGTVEWTLDDSFRPVTPAGPGQWVFKGICFAVVPAIVYQVEVNPTNIVVKDENLNTLTTISYSTVSGDIYRLEMSGPGFRLFLNGVLQHSRTGLALTYNLDYSTVLTKPVAHSTVFRIPGPKLIGDWRQPPSITWTTPGHGQLSTLGLTPSTIYGGGTIPGIYTLVGQLEPAADGQGIQRATATIEIPALVTLGQNPIALQSGQKIRFKTNYDAAQNDLIAWSSPKGTFTQNEFTAPTAASAPFLVTATASVNSQVATITASVPPTITNASGYTAAKPSEQIDFDTNILASDFPTFISAGAMAEGTGSITPGLPLFLQENDIMLLFVETANELVAVSTPAGWAIVADSPQGTGTAGDVAATRLSVFWKRAIFSETAPVLTDPGDHTIGQILAFRGCVTSGNPWDVTSGDTGASSTSVSIPGDTTTVANCLIVLAVANQTDSATPQTSGYTNSDLASLTERTDVNTTQGN